MRIEAKEGFTFKRIHDGFIMGGIIYLGIDYSTGEPREDKAEYYEEIKDESIEEIAINRQKEIKITEFQEYFNYCEECKMIAKNILNK